MTCVWVAVHRETCDSYTCRPPFIIPRTLTRVQISREIFKRNRYRVRQKENKWRGGYSNSPRNIAGYTTDPNLIARYAPYESPTWLEDVILVSLVDGGLGRNERGDEAEENDGPGGPHAADERFFQRDRKITRKSGSWANRWRIITHAWLCSIGHYGRERIGRFVDQSG